jgi:hypothetical protein
MQIRTFTIPVHSGREAEAELNRFLGAHRIVSVDRDLVQDGANSAWTLCVSYETGEGRAQGPAGGKKAKRDPREVLTPEEFAVYDNLRQLRREMADRDGVPPYSLFTNEQLMEVCQRARSASFAAGPGTRTPGTCVRPCVTRTTPTTATTTWASAVPELKTGPEGPGLNRPPSRAFPRFAGARRNPMAPGVLVAASRCPAKARRVADLLA